MTDKTDISTGSETGNAKIDLGEMTLRYLESLQRIFDIVNYSFASSRLLSEQELEAFSRRHKAMPAYNKRRSFDAAKEEYERWMVTHLLNDGFTALILFLEDARTIAQLSKLKAEAHLSQEAVQRTMNQDRKDFLLRDFPSKFKALAEEHEIESPFTSHLLGLYSALTVMLRQGGKVRDDDVGSDGVLTVSIKHYQAAPSDVEAAPDMADPQETTKTFAVGDKVTISKEEALSCLVTFAFFIVTAAQSLQKRAIDLGVLGASEAAS